MNNANIDITSDTTNGPAEITRIGAGEIQIDRSIESKIIAYCPEDGQPSLSFGQVDVSQNMIIRKKVKIINLLGNEQQHVKFSTISRSSQASGITIEMEVAGIADHNIVLESCGETVVDILFHLSAEEMPTNHMDSGIDGINPSALSSNELAGYIVFTSSNDYTISLPWHMLARKASDLVLDRTFLSSAYPETVMLTNNGAGTAQLDAFDILALSDEKERGHPGKLEPTPDIRAVGVKSVLTPVTDCSSRFSMEFAITLWDRQTHLMPLRFKIHIDLDQDGIDDFYVFNGAVADGDSRQMTFVVNVATGEMSSEFFAEHATNSKTTILTICGEQISLDLVEDVLLQPSHEMTVKVVAEDFYFGGPGDSTNETFTLIPFGERFTHDPGERWTLRHDLGDSADVLPGETAPFNIYDMGDHTFINPNSYGLMLITNADRGEGNRGGATIDSEVHLLLAPGVKPPESLGHKGNEGLSSTNAVNENIGIICTMPDQVVSQAYQDNFTVSEETKPPDINSTEEVYLSSPNTTCIQDLSIIFEEEMEVSQIDQVRTYKLCPGRRYNIGTISSTGYVMPPLQIFHPNIHIICGDDGKLSNDCVLEGGQYHIFIYNVGENLTNIRFSGLTFENAKDYNVYAAGQSDDDGIVFHNCAFKQNTNFAIIYTDTSEKNQELSVSLDTCLFEDNWAIFGLIYNFEQTIKISRSKFRNNFVLDGDHTFLIGNFYGGHMELHESCFETNTVQNSLILNLESTIIVDESNYKEENKNFARDNTFSASNHCDGLFDFHTELCTPFTGASCPDHRNARLLGGERRGLRGKSG